MKTNARWAASRYAGSWVARYASMNASPHQPLSSKYAVLLTLRRPGYHSYPPTGFRFGFQ
jgi:hypothetical protein